MPLCYRACAKGSIGGLPLKAATGCLYPKASEAMQAAEALEIPLSARSSVTYGASIPGRSDRQRINIMIHALVTVGCGRLAPLAGWRYHAAAEIGLDGLNGPTPRPDGGAHAGRFFVWGAGLCVVGEAPSAATDLLLFRHSPARGLRLTGVRSRSPRNAKRLVPEFARTAPGFSKSVAEPRDYARPEAFRHEQRGRCSRHDLPRTPCSPSSNEKTD